MKLQAFNSRRAFTLLEVTLVIGLLAIITAMIIPNFLREVKEEEFPGSAGNFDHC